MQNVDWEKVSKRINEVIQVDVMSARQEDFLLTHMPFANLGVSRSGLSNAQSTDMSEEEIYQTLVRNPENQHRFIIVKGNNGSGKSHLIRWLHARMENDLKNENREDEKLVFIRRIDNTLRGAIGQLLEQDIVSDPEKKKNLEAFVKSTETMTREALILRIYNEFVALLRLGEQQVFKPTELKQIMHTVKIPVRRNQKTVRT